MEGGVGAFTQRLAQALAVLGYEVHVITSRDARPAVQNGDWRSLREPLDLGYARLHPRGRRWRWWDVNLIADLIKQHDLALVNIQYQAAAYNMRSPAINLAPWRLRGLAPAVVTFHDLRVPYLFPKSGRLRWRLLLFMARAASGIIVTNPGDYDTLRPVLERPLRLIPIGSNVIRHATGAEAVARARAELGLAPSAVLLGYFGFLNPSKGADLLLEAAALSRRPTHVVFIGGRTGDSDGATNSQFLEELDARIQALGLEDRVHWTGFRPDDEISAFLQAADLMVMPYRDGASLRRGTLMAIMAHGRPLVTTEPLAPTPELVHEGNCWLVPRDNAAALAEAINYLGGEPALAARLGEAAETLSGLFNWESIAEKTAAFYDHLLRGER
jgi:glycosyltransferase involved in cell wall biosynthesis